MLPKFSLILIPGGFWLGVSTSLVATLLWVVLHWWIRVLQHILRVSSSEYRINGIWIGPCTLPRPTGEVEGIEIYHLNRRKENVTFSFFHYRHDTQEVVRYEGAGVFRGQVLSAFYFIADSEHSESGVFVLRTLDEMFKGIYAQYVSGMKPYQSQEDFILRRIQIPFWAQVKMLMHQPPFRSYTQVKQLYEAARTEQPEAVVQV